MSRSKKKTPVHSICIIRAGEMAEFKRRTNKKLRAATKRAIESEKPDPRTPNAVIERWNAPDDGKTYDPEFTRGLRK